MPAITKHEIDDWESELDEFDHKILPLFIERGYSKDLAFLCWTLQKIRNDIADVEEAVRDMDDSDDQC